MSNAQLFAVAILAGGFGGFVSGYIAASFLTDSLEKMIYKLHDITQLLEGSVKVLGRVVFAQNDEIKACKQALQDRKEGV